MLDTDAIVFGFLPTRPKPFSNPDINKWRCPPLSSFTRTIPRATSADAVQQVLNRSDHYLPLAYRPTKANAGDFIYLVFRDLIIGRTRISTIHAVDDFSFSEAGPYPDWAKWIIRYKGGWESPPRDIPVQGHQSVRYLESHALEHLDHESW
jgi:hypothetical protein